MSLPSGNMAKQVKGKGSKLKILPPVQILVPGKPGNKHFYSERVFPGNGETPPILYGKRDKAPKLPS